MQDHIPDAYMSALTRLRDQAAERRARQARGAAERRAPAAAAAEVRAPAPQAVE